MVISPIVYLFHVCVSECICVCVCECGFSNLLCNLSLFVSLSYIIFLVVVNLCLCFFQLSLSTQFCVLYMYKYVLLRLYSFISMLSYVFTRWSYLWAIALRVWLHFTCPSWWIIWWKIPMEFSSLYDIRLLNLSHFIFRFFFLFVFFRRKNHITEQTRTKCMENRNKQADSRKIKHPSKTFKRTTEMQELKLVCYLVFFLNFGKLPFLCKTQWIHTKWKQWKTICASCVCFFFFSFLG